MAMKKPETNSEWLSGLKTEGRIQETAIGSLREILIRGLKHGLTQYISTLGDRYEPMMEDIAQEALIKILDNIDSFRGESQFTTWACKIAVRTALTEMRRKKWRDVSLDEIMEARNNDRKINLQSNKTPAPDNEIERKEIMDKLTEIIQKKLSKKQKTALMSVMIGGMPLEEVARKMKTNRNAVYKLIHDARVRIRRIMEQTYMSPTEALKSFER